MSWKIILLIQLHILVAYVIGYKLGKQDAKKSLFGRMNHELENHFINTIAHFGGVCHRV